MARPTSRLSAHPASGLAPGASPQVLRTWARVQAPLCRLLLEAGIDFAQAATELRSVFLEQAHAHIVRGQAADTDSALSLLSGVHRKEVRKWRQQARAARAPAPVPLTAQVFALWSSLPGYRGRDRRPKPIPRVGPAPSFEALARRLTQDIHPFSLLQELARLGVVELSQRKGAEFVVPRDQGFVPAGDLEQLLELFGMNLADHAATAVANIVQEAPRLEQSVFADGLGAASMARLEQLARELWAQVRDRMVTEALRCLESDREDACATGRMRFGAYYWNATEQAEPTPAAKPARRRKAAAGNRRPSRTSKEPS